MYKVYGIIDEGKIVYIDYMDMNSKYNKYILNENNIYEDIYDYKITSSVYKKEYSDKDIVILRDNIEYNTLAAIIVKDAASALKPKYNNDIHYSVLPLYIEKDVALAKEYEHLMLLLF